MSEPELYAIEAALRDGEEALRLLVGDKTPAWRVAMLGRLLSQLARRQQAAAGFRAVQETAYRQTVLPLVEGQAIIEKIIKPDIEQLIAGSGRRSLDVPGIGSFGLRQLPASWDVTDQDQAIASLSADEKAVLVKAVERLDALAFKKYLDECEAEGTIVPGVERVPARDVLTIKFTQEEARHEG